MEKEKIEAIKAWPKLESISDIQVFLGFAHFYKQFIKDFSKIAALFILMLKILAPSVLARPARTRPNEN